MSENQESNKKLNPYEEKVTSSHKLTDLVESVATPRSSQLSGATQTQSTLNYTMSQSQPSQNFDLNRPEVLTSTL